jgi:hypothetical protein
MKTPLLSTQGVSLAFGGVFLLRGRFWTTWVLEVTARTPDR